MEIKQVPTSGYPLSLSIRDFNENFKKVAGNIDQAKFDVNELEQIFACLALPKKFERNVSLGHIISDYGDWTHVKAESGYSIWKITPSNYSYNEDNQAYFDGKLLTNKGEGSSEDSSAFDKVYLYNGTEYLDHTTEAGSEGGTAFSLMDDTNNDVLYLGSASQFTGISFEFKNWGAIYTLKVEYSSSQSGVWETLGDADSLVDDTSNFKSDGRIHFTAPSDWVTYDVNGETKYWIRITTTTTPIGTEAKAFKIVPSTSACSLLQLSGSEVKNKTWAWSSYNNDVYVTIPNTGEPQYEGILWIASSSTSTNKENFFVYEHEYKIDYENSTYDPVLSKSSNYTLVSDDGIVFIDASIGSVTITLPSATGIEGKRFIIKVLTIGSGESASVACQSGETIDGSATYDFSSDYECITVVSDGSDWGIIAKKS